MSELSVSDHLEGILSDFEALKRSFDIEDVDDEPSFSSASPISNPTSSSSSQFFLDKNKASEGPGGGGLFPSPAFSNNSPLGSAAHCKSLSSRPSPVFKSRTVVSSLSFNRGTKNKPVIHNNGSSVTRAASFQSRSNPNSYSLLSGPSSDNDSLHSSTSSLEFSGGFGGAPSLSKLGSYASPPSQGDCYPIQHPIQQRGGGDNLGSINNLKKLSSLGSVFHSDMDQSPGRMLSSNELQGLNSSMPSLDHQIYDGGAGMKGVQKSGGGMSPGLRYANADATWNGHRPNAPSFEDAYCGPTNHCQQQVPQVIKAPQHKAKEITRLNKFPLDLDSLVNSSPTTSPTRPPARSMSPNPPKPPPRSTGDVQHHTSPPSTLASPSPSLSSLDSSSDTPTFSLHHPFLPFSPRSPTSSQGSIPVPEMRGSPGCSQAEQSPQLGILSKPQLLHFPPSSPYSPASPRSIQSLDDCPGDASDSVGSILQRIASFSESGMTDSNREALNQPATVQSKGWFSSAAGCTSETMTMPSGKQGKDKHEETAGDLKTGPPAPMEETEDNEKGLAAQELSDSRREGRAAATEEESCAEGRAAEEETQEEETEEEAKAELRQSAPGLRMSFIRGDDLFGYVGIEAVLDQMRRKTMKAGFEFNIMVVGQSGLGKSTLVNTLFKSKVSRKSCTANYEEKICKTVKLHSVSHVIEEKGVKMKLTVIDTPGFGDQINNENCWEPIVKYVRDQYEKYLREELHVNRKRRIPDTRVHCCIYFLPATGHRLRPIDIEFMKRLGKIVSIVPVIAKADTLTIEERLEFKERIRRDLAANGIRVYPQKEYDEDPEEQILNDRIRENIPFAVVGTDKEHQVNGNKVLGRKTKWGIIEVENVAHCEFANLRDLLIRSHLQDLKDVTHNIHYETYRVRRLNESNVDFGELSLSAWPLENGIADKLESESQL